MPERETCAQRDARHPRSAKSRKQIPDARLRELSHQQVVRLCNTRTYLHNGTGTIENGGDRRQQVREHAKETDATSGPRVRQVKKSRFRPSPPAARRRVEKTRTNRGRQVPPLVGRKCLLAPRRSGRGGQKMFHDIHP